MGGVQKHDTRVHPRVARALRQAG
ncbi:hypothetical protein DYH09_01755 [bacterium CPR1]|nr:hypothetical protein [bacterium CPR1]